MDRTDGAAMKLGSTRLLLTVLMLVGGLLVAPPPAGASIFGEDDQIATVGELFVFRPSVTGAEISFVSIPDTALAYDDSKILFWRPTANDIGRHEVVYEIDLGYATARRAVQIDVHSPRSVGLVLAMGDSIASGQGLERGDYFGFDSCNRDSSPGGAWTRRVFDQLLLDGDATSFRMVACGGARTFNLWQDPVSGGPRDRSAEDLSQLDWALVSNPDLVLVTVGANDLNFDDPSEFFTGGQFDRELAAERIARMQDGIDRLLKEMVEGSAAQVVITTVHNPTSEIAHGLAGCRGRCFYDVTVDVVEMVRTAILEAAAPYPDRVLVVDVSSVLDGHAAPNGRGPDSLRAGSGWLSRLLPIPTRGVQPYCQKGHAVLDTWVNAADCVHPNGQGHQAYANAVLSALAD
ncbi:MAG: hypothetical protein GXP35_01940 [Actinobacteria bacterium]|nr:hypothetical protein [Actinomycetota bacterium]